MIYAAAIALFLTAVRYTLAVRGHGSRVLYEIPAAALAGLLAGLWFGVAARVAMRLVAMAAGAPLRLSAGGSIQVVLVFAAIGGGVGILYAGLFRHALATSGARFALLVFLATWYPLAQAGADLIGRKADFFASGVVIALMWLPYALLLERIAPPLCRRMTRVAEVAAA
jgi:hypothetical protein